MALCASRGRRVKSFQDQDLVVCARAAETVITALHPRNSEHTASLDQQSAEIRCVLATMFKKVQHDADSWHETTSERLYLMLFMTSQNYFVPMPPARQDRVCVATRVSTSLLHLGRGLSYM